MVQDFYGIFDCFRSIGLCLLMSVTYVASLHVWKSPHNRDHPSTIKKRFISVFFMLFISPCFLYIGIHSKTLEKISLLGLLGFKTRGLCQATVMPLFLTMILFLGPIAMKIHSGLLKLYTEPMYWINNMKNLIWLRNHLVAPLSEEFTYRSCMLPLLLECFSPMTAVSISPLFFGVAHFHHMQERIKYGMDFNTAFKIACFQFVYTTIFGMYSAYLLLRTGHFMSTFIVHAFCNHMGFPDLVEVTTYKREKKIIITCLFFVGFGLWCLLLNPLTEPTWYYNNLSWYKVK
ncbi:CAAX prenyl protease 2 isoform X1 [Tribolium madens]|uniref:CAAX prenyl protease 2 isoform X1 n=2 Tax=Tribolium madens TaxID=41895 RepID=UPI001CF7473C|nr:CAAX prenyl protease 2 isoform X1 [Tribolium madens]